MAEVAAICAEAARGGVGGADPSRLRVATRGTAMQDNTVLSSGLAVSLALLLFVPNWRATIGYEHEVPTLVAPPAR